MLIGAVVAEPGDFRADVAGIQVASAQLAKPMRVHPFSRLIALSLRPSIHPNQGRAHRLPVGVGRDQPVELRAERQCAHRGPVHGATYLGKRRRDGAQPLAWILLRPPRLGIGERMRHISLRRLISLWSQRLGAGALRADIHPDNQLRLHFASSDSSPGPRR